MKTILEKLTSKPILSAKLVKKGMKQIDNKDMFCNQFRVSVKTDSSDTSFLFHGSHKDYQEGKIELGESDLIFAFYCFISDSIAGDLTFEEFCSELGYAIDSRKGEKIWKECGKSLNKSKQLFGDVYDVMNELREFYNDYL